jgi:glyoxalase family protein
MKVEQVTPWQKGPIPLAHAITGLGPVFIRIANFDYFKEMLEKYYYLKKLLRKDHSIYSK